MLLNFHEAYPLQSSGFMPIMGRWGLRSPTQTPALISGSTPRCPLWPAGYGSPRVHDSRLGFLHAGQTAGLAAEAVMRYLHVFSNFHTSLYNPPHQEDPRSAGACGVALTRSVTKRGKKASSEFWLAVPVINLPSDSILTNPSGSFRAADLYLHMLLCGKAFPRVFFQARHH